jgi:hypothetical protein
VAASAAANRASDKDDAAKNNSTAAAALLAGAAERWQARLARALPAAQAALMRGPLGEVAAALDEALSSSDGKPTALKTVNTTQQQPLKTAREAVRKLQTAAVGGLVGGAGGLSSAGLSSLGETLTAAVAAARGGAAGQEGGGAGVAAPTVWEWLTAAAAALPALAAAIL